MLKFIRLAIIIRILISLSLFVPSIVLGDYARDRAFSDRRDEIYKDKSIPYRERVSRSLDLHESMYGSGRSRGSSSSGSGIFIIIILGVGIYAYYNYMEKQKFKDSSADKAMLATKTNKNKTDPKKNVKQDSLAHENMKKCPFCAEFVKPEAIYCRYCKKNISESDIENDVTLSQNEVRLSVVEIKNKCTYLIKNNKIDEAINLLTRAINNNMDSHDMLYIRAAAYSKINDKKNMINDLRKASLLGNISAKERLNKIVCKDETGLDSF